METACKYEECTKNCVDFKECTNEKKLKFDCFHNTRRRVWLSFRRYSFYTKFQRNINDNTVYYHL